ncbi:MAG: DUF1275 domain-containing protein [Lachnospiraceae bacterium]|nr:DUF1275 domain-containing protein [Lachnospiraceae bacterium]
MRILNEQEKRDSLNDVLIELSKSQDILKEPKDRASFFVRLESIYYNYEKENFRHYYSDIFSTLTLIDGDASIGSLDILAQNIQTIKNGYIPKNCDENGEIINISKEIVKLYDHTNLDIARINYTKTMTNETLSELAKNRLLVVELEQKVKVSEESLNSLSNKTIDDVKYLSNQFQIKQEDMQKEYITILGIFASIVLAFTGGIVFSSSVLENIHKSSIYRISIIAFIIGLVFFNLIWLLMDFIRDINGKVIRKKWLWLMVNLILIGGIIGTCFSYKYGWFIKD